MTESQNNTQEIEGLLMEGLSPFPIEGADPSFLDAPFSKFNALKVIQSQTNPKWIKGKKIGSKELSYVSGDTVTRLLNKAFLYKWSFYILETRVVKSQDKVNKYKKDEVPEAQASVIQVHGRLVVPGFGVREQWGAQPLSGGADVQEHAFKSASTDAMKKCASMFGIALDLYGQEGIEELAVTPMDYLAEDDKMIENMKVKLTKQREAQLKEQQKQQQPSQTEQTQPEPVKEKVEYPSQPSQEEQPVQQPVVQTEPQTPVQPPVQEPAPVNTSPQWTKEDIEGLRSAKQSLGIDATNNEGLNSFTQEFFGTPEATYRNISPENVKDFLHFLSSKY